MLSIVSKPLLASLHILAIISKWSCEEPTDSIHLPNTQRRRTAEVEKREEKKKKSERRNKKRRKVGEKKEARDNKCRETVREKEEWRFILIHLLHFLFSVLTLFYYYYNKNWRKQNNKTLCLTLVTSIEMILNLLKNLREFGWEFNLYWICIERSITATKFLNEWIWLNILGETRFAWTNVWWRKTSEKLWEG